MDKGELDLGAILESNSGDHWETWEHALLRLDTRQMPPPDKDRPEEGEAGIRIAGWRSGEVIALLSFSTSSTRPSNSPPLI